MSPSLGNESHVSILIAAEMSYKDDEYKGNHEDLLKICLFSSIVILAMDFFCVYALNLMYPS
jgi:hypothetical protein